VLRRVLPVFPFLLSLTVLAADAPRVAETIVVTADRNAETLGDQTDSVTVITAEQLRASQQPTVIEALRQVAGVSIMQSGSPGHNSSIFIRGASPGQALVLIDGMSVDNPFFGGVDLSSMLTSGIERIEIVRGPQSPLYGSDAMAGVINIITSQPKNGTAASFDVEAGSESTNREAAQLGGGSGIAHWSLNLGHFATDGQFANDEFRSTQLNGRVAFDLSTASTLTLHALHDSSHIGIPFNGSAPSPERNDDSKLTIGGATYDLHASPLVNVTLRGDWTHRNDDFRDPMDPFSQRTIDESTIVRGTLQNVAVAGDHTLLTGVEQQNQDVTDDSNSFRDLDETIHTTALYAQDKFEHGAFTLTGGARWDHHSSFGSHLSPRISAALKVAPSWRVRIGAGSAFRAPSAGELAYPFYGNPDLKPETSRSYEAGADYATSRLSFSITAFESRYRQLITFNPVTFVAANIANARIRGLETSAAMRLTTRWRGTIAYTNLDTRDGNGVALVRRPRNLGSSTLTYDAERWGATGSVVVVGRRLEEDFTTFTNRYNPGYAKFDLASFWRVREHLRVTARVENLFDRQYAEVLAFPARGRTVYGGLQFGL
jgi:vitamin B12 transporter